MFSRKTVSQETTPPTEDDQHLNTPAARRPRPGMRHCSLHHSGNNPHHQQHDHRERKTGAEDLGKATGHANTTQHHQDNPHHDHNQAHSSRRRRPRHEAQRYSEQKLEETSDPGRFVAKNFRPRRQVKRC